jgi:hypothetical protein
MDNEPGTLTPAEIRRLCEAFRERHPAKSRAGDFVNGPRHGSGQHAMLIPIWAAWVRQISRV